MKTTLHTLRLRWRWILAPALAFIALATWAFASPVGAAPDDDYHLVSIWCANGGSDYCADAPTPEARIVPAGLIGVACYGQHPERTAECQVIDDAGWAAHTRETTRGNFAGEYPPVYYATMRLFAGDDVTSSALAMRLVNAALFVALATALAALLDASRRRTLVWGWLVTLVPLGVFLIPSNNPSGWAITGVGTAFLSLLGWFEASGRRRWALGALYIVGVVLAAGARGDAAVYVVGASVTAALLTAEATKTFAARAALPLAGALLALVFFAMAGQSGVASSGFTSDGPGTGAEASLGGAALAASNLLMVPFLWTGVWGTWGLGWLDTTMPAIVPWAAVAAFIVVGFGGLGLLTRRKAVAAVGVLAVLVGLPVYVLTAGGDQVGENLQPRYLLPLIVLFAFVVLAEPAGRRLVFTRVQTFAVLAAVTGAHLVALQINLRRYVTGADQQGPNLDAGAEWWWPGAAVGPMAVWAAGTLAFASLVAVLWPVVRPAPKAATESQGA